MAGEAFKDEKVLKIVREFVPILVDGDVDKEFGSQFSASGYPHVVFVNSRGKELGRVRGYVPTAEFLAQATAALKKNGRIRLTKAAKALEKADADLTEARRKGDWRGVLRAVAAIEKIGHVGAVLERAADARTAADAEASSRIAAARALVEEGKADEARKILSKVRSHFAALPERVKEARDLLGEIEKAEDD